MMKPLDMRPGPLLYGAATFIPGVARWRRRGTGGSVSARYCYSVWLRHFVRLAENGLRQTPGTVAEIGPGDSLGVGLAALLCGAERYLALDTVRYAETERNEAILDELIGLFRDRAAVPDEAEFPDVMPKLSSYRFPERLLSPSILNATLNPERLDRVRKALRGPDPDGRDGLLLYAAPWTDPKVIADGSADLILSQAVLEHVDDLDGTYSAMARWLKPGGLMSHVIDFSSHGLTRSWNGHWGLPAIAWKTIRGKRHYLINREPLSTHLRLLETNGFGTLAVLPRSGASGIGRRRLARGFGRLTDGDLDTACAYVATAKPRPARQAR
jgi:hypothetical protein